VAALNDAVIRTIDLAKTYGSSASPVHALRGVSISIARAEKVALVGKSGSGKSTLLNLLGGLDRPSGGSIEIGGRDLARLTSNQLAQHRLATVGMVFQSFNLIPSRTALQNVELPMIFAARSAADRRQAARQALETVGLAERLHHRPGELSGGEHQRVAIARALVNHPAILLADEPTGNLDSITSAAIMETLLAYVKEHRTTLVLVTHDEELAARVADRMLRLHDGSLVNTV
jgi:predicted ABC-type transport system involved in lysophospholipase L1 biosynthesis ATPase subunit